jgi:hypothetical protein
MRTSANSSCVVSKVEIGYTQAGVLLALGPPQLLQFRRLKGWLRRLELFRI